MDYERVAMNKEEEIHYFKEAADKGHASSMLK